MSEIEDKLDALGYTEYINCVLVRNNVRNGYLFQTIDYKEYHINDPISSNKIAKITEYFPELMQLECSQGVLISKNTYTLNDIDTESQLGAILGFPCEIPLDKNITKYIIDICVETDLNKSIPLYSFCSDKQEIEYVTNITEKIRGVVNTPDSELYDIIDDIFYTSTVEYPVGHYINLLKNMYQTLSKDDLRALVNYWYNAIGDYRILEFENIITTSSAITNPIIRGTIIGLLMYYQNCPVEPFFPLQNQGVGKMNEVEEKLRLWADQLILSIS